MFKKFVASLGIASMVLFMVFGTTVLFNSSKLGVSVAQASEGEHAEEAKHESEGGINLKPIGAGLAVGLAALATAWAQSSIGPAGIGAILEKPDTMPAAIIFLAIPETPVILGFVIAAMIMLF
ncbi:MAG: hypothetical protein ACE5GM_00810 [bacterium]